MLPEEFKETIEKELIEVSPVQVRGNDPATEVVILADINFQVVRSGHTPPADDIASVVTNWNDISILDWAPAMDTTIEGELLIDQSLSDVAVFDSKLVFRSDILELEIIPEETRLNKLEILMEIPAGSTSGITVELFQLGKKISEYRRYYFELEGLDWHPVWLGKLNIRSGEPLIVKISENPLDENSEGFKVYVDKIQRVLFKSYYSSFFRWKAVDAYQQFLTIRVVAKNDNQTNSQNAYVAGDTIRDTIMSVLLTKLRSWEGKFEEAQVGDYTRIITNLMILGSAEGGKFWAEIRIPWYYLFGNIESDPEYTFKRINLRDIRLIT